MMGGMDNLVQFLHARYDEDEQAAHAAKGGPWHTDGGSVYATHPTDEVVDYTESGEHIARHDPARVLAEVDAKRRRLARHTPERRRLALDDADGTTSMAFLICTSCTPNRVIRREEQDIVVWPCPDLLDDAAVHADHPDYRDEWRPSSS
jgi:hypothetical protein